MVIREFEQRDRWWPSTPPPPRHTSVPVHRPPTPPPAPLRQPRAQRLQLSVEAQGVASFQAHYIGEVCLDVATQTFVENAAEAADANTSPTLLIQASSVTALVLATVPSTSLVS